jgi:isopentenyl-diphosphate delta-isomerase
LTEADDIASRKSDHVEIVLKGGGSQSLLSAGFDDILFEHVAVPEMSLDDVDLSCKFLGRDLKAPLLVSSMTGGFAKGARINEHLAEAAQARGIALAVGSQRIAIEAGGQVGLDGKIRSIAPDIPIYANFGGAQLVRGYGLTEAQRAIELLDADALIIHLNPLQEAVQTSGDLDWSGLLRHLESIVNRCEKPIIVKEVGFGISGRTAKQILDCGVAAIDVAGAGGTNWALVESHRALTNEEAAVASAFAGWGIPTTKAISDVRHVCPDLPVIGSGGIRNGVDSAKAIRVGADIVGMAGALLEAATQSADAVDRAIGTIIDQLRIACFCTGSRSLKELQTARLVE